MVVSATSYVPTSIGKNRGWEGGHLHPCLVCTVVDVPLFSRPAQWPSDDDSFIPAIVASAIPGFYRRLGKDGLEEHKWTEARGLLLPALYRDMGMYVHHQERRSISPDLHGLLGILCSASRYVLPTWRLFVQRGVSSSRLFFAPVTFAWFLHSSWGGWLDKARFKRCVSGGRLLELVRTECAMSSVRERTYTYLDTSTVLLDYPDMI